MMFQKYSITKIPLLPQKEIVEYHKNPLGDKGIFSLSVMKQFYDLIYSIPRTPNNFQTSKLGRP
jgi:hypothetical protein